MTSFKKAVEIVKRLQDSGYIAYFAGGYVRDMLLGITSNDIDIATNAIPEVVESMFDKTIPVGKQFGVVIVVIDSEEFEVATFRNDGNYSDGRHPDVVTFSSPQEDAKRRDFTINGMFYNPITDDILDYVGGQNDLELGIIRCIRDPFDRFEEDKLRMLRAIRFACKLGFEIENTTFTAIQNNAFKLKEVSVERIFQELTKILTNYNACNALVILESTGLLRQIFFIVYPCITTYVLDYLALRIDVEFHRIIVYFSKFEKLTDIEAWSLLLQFETPDAIQHILIRFKVSNDFVKSVVKTVELMKLVSQDVLSFPKFQHKVAMVDSRFKSAIDLQTNVLNVNYEYFDSTENNNPLNWIITLVKYECCNTLNPPELVNGDDLLAIGYKQDYYLGKMLQQIRFRQLNEEIATKEIAIMFATDCLKCKLEHDNYECRLPPYGGSIDQFLPVKKDKI